MKKKTNGLIIIGVLLFFLIVLITYLIVSKSKNIEFYAKVTESFKDSSIVEPLKNESIHDTYPILQVDVGGFKVGDLVKFTCNKEFIETYPPVARVKKYEYIINNTSSTTDFPKNDLSNENNNQEVLEDTTAKNTSTIGANSTTKITSSIYVPSTSIKITKEITTTIAYYSDSSTDNKVLNNLQTKINNIEINKTDKTFGETAKEYFISAVDFIFYDKDINGVYFKDLTASAKLKAINLTLKLDNLIDKYYPGYKDNISSSYQNIKTKLIELYLNKTSEYCASNDKVCNQAKDDFQDMKTSYGITWDIIKALGNAGISKLKEWYEIYSGK